MKWNKNNKPISWSSISSFRYDKDKWYRSYVLGIKDPPSKEMEFGSYIGKKLETDSAFLPEVPRQSTMEYKLHCPFGDIEIIGYCDSYGELVLREYKTSSNKNRWTQQSVDEHGQITMYLLMLYITQNIKPEDVKVVLTYIPVEDTFDNGMQLNKSIPIGHFETKRTIKDIIMFGVEINKTVKEMENYENTITI